MLDLHRHDEYSSFDGFGKPSELAKLAKSYGYTALSSSNHGNTNGLVQHYFACKEEGIKPVLGVEGYFLPKYKEKHRGFHLCLFAMNLDGYKNLNRIQFAGEKQKYYNPIWTFKELRKYNKGIICTSACVGGFIPQMLLDGREDLAKRATEKFIDIFGDNFYIEIQPYTVDDEGTQEEINLKLIELANELNVKCILTSDSHYGSKKDFSSYLKLHEIAKHDLESIEETYKKRYMPKPEEFVERFVKMHGDDFGVKKAKRMALEMIDNLEELEAKIDGDILEQLQLLLPVFDKNGNSTELIVKKVREGLRKRGKHKDKTYIKRCKTELEVIKHHGFEDYFLIVQDYVNYAKSKGIAVGKGRGSVCNCQVAWALKITDVDSLKYGLDFRRFLRKDKLSYPDIDLDFPTDRRGEVIDYLLEKYEGMASQIASYGLYKVDNLVNDLAKVCGCDEDGVKALIKKHINKFSHEGEIDLEALKMSYEYKQWNKLYDNIMFHFCKLYKKMRFIGTHAGGVAITGGSILDYTALRIDQKTGRLFTAYDLNDLGKINLMKFDILGLKTMQSLAELRELTGRDGEDDSYTEDEKVIEAFAKGNTNGVFQFDKRTPQEILVGINTNSFNDVIACSSMNRPAPLSLGMPQMYAENKEDSSKLKKDSPYYEFVKDTYGTVIYQEQVMMIAHYVGGLEWKDCDKLIKMERNATEKNLILFKENYEKYWKQFWKGAKSHGMDKEESKELYDSFFNYSFNKGHSTGYSLISCEEMYFKVYHPTEFWYTKVKYAGSDSDRHKFIREAILEGVLVFLPHVNYTAQTSLRTVEGELIIQQGMNMVKGCGDKACDAIEEERRLNGSFKSLEDFKERMSGNRAVHKGVIQKLVECGALEFNKKKYYGRVVKYNSSWLARK